MLHHWTYSMAQPESDFGVSCSGSDCPSVQTWRRKLGHRNKINELRLNSDRVWSSVHLDAVSLFCAEQYNQINEEFYRASGIDPWELGKVFYDWMFFSPRGLILHPTPRLPLNSTIKIARMKVIPKDFQMSSNSRTRSKLNWALPLIVGGSLVGQSAVSALSLVGQSGECYLIGWSAESVVSHWLVSSIDAISLVGQSAVSALSLVGQSVSDNPLVDQFGQWLVRWCILRICDRMLTCQPWGRLHQPISAFQWHSPASWAYSFWKRKDGFFSATHPEVCHMSLMVCKSPGLIVNRYSKNIP